MTKTSFERWSEYYCSYVHLSAQSAYMVSFLGTSPENQSCNKFLSSSAETNDFREKKSHYKITKITYPKDCKPSINSFLENSHMVPAFMCHERTNWKKFQHS